MIYFEKVEKLVYLNLFYICIQIKQHNYFIIRIYNVERTICDIIKNKNKIDAEIFSKTLKEYPRSKNKNLTKLTKYAKTMNIENKVREYMEVLL